MSPEELQRRLRNLPLGGELFVKRDSLHAARYNYHPDAYQIWDRERVSGRPYCVLVCQKRGKPVPLDDRIVRLMAEKQIKHNGEEAELDRQMRKFRDEDERLDMERDRRFASAWGEKIDVPGRVRSRMGRTKKWKLNSSVLPESCASPNSSKQSATA